VAGFCFADPVPHPLLALFAIAIRPAPSMETGGSNFIMSLSEWSKVAQKWHEPLRRVMAKYENAEMTTDEIRTVSASIPGVGNNVKFIQPPDHCLNVTNKGACPCAETEESLFVQVRRGVYLVR